MGFRDRKVSASILRAIFLDARTQEASHKKGLLSRILAFFSVFQVTLGRYQDKLFHELRSEVWGVDEEDYRQSFWIAEKGSGKKVKHGDGREGGGLEPVGDLGYSGSTFFTTPDSKYLIKSIPRHFEYAFFADELLPHYAEHMRQHPESLLVRITDFLYSPHASLGGAFGTAPTHHIVMENILYGKSATPEEAGVRRKDWETYDLKPADYFFPERDIAGGRLAPESVKSRLIDKFEDEMRVTKEQRDELLRIFERDTELLRDCNAVDYSLFLIRYPTPQPSEATTSPAPTTLPDNPPTAASSRSRVPALPSWRNSRWREGVRSADGKWIYRVLVLDFFWAKHKLQPRAMTQLVKGFNFFARKGAMSITTDPGEYRERFLRMVRDYLRVGDGRGNENGNGNGEGSGRQGQEEAGAAEE